MAADRLIVLHGWGSNLANWHPFTSRLNSKKLRLWLPHLPSDQVRNTADFSQWLYRQTKNRPAFNLLGHSFGGQIATQFAAAHPGRVKKLILVGSAGIRRRGFKARLFLPLAKMMKYMPAEFKSLAYRLIGETDYFKANPVMKETMKLILKEDQQENMKRISAPTLIVWGKKDRYTPPRYADLTHRLIKNSRLVFFPEAGHGLPFTHAPELAEKVLWFLGLK